MGRDDRSRDGQPKTGAARLARPGRVEPDERLEDAFGIDRIEADPCVGHGDEGRAIAPSQGQIDGSTAWRVLHRVLHQIDHGSSQSDLLAADGDGRQLFHADGDAGVLTESYAEIESLEQD